MRALYVTWPTNDTWRHVQRAISYGGIDTLLVGAQDVPANPPSEYYNSYTEVVNNLIRAGQFGIPVFPVVTWDREWCNFEGVRARCSNWAAFHKNVIVDWEDYRKQRTGLEQRHVPPDITEIMREEGVESLGAMPESGHFGGLSFIESTYNDKGRIHLIKEKWKHGKNAIAGINIDEEGPDYVKKVNRCFDNIWLWSAGALGQSGNHRPRPWKLEWWEQI